MTRAEFEEQARELMVRCGMREADAMQLVSGDVAELANLLTELQRADKINGQLAKKVVELEGELKLRDSNFIASTKPIIEARELAERQRDDLLAAARKLMVEDQLQDWNEAFDEMRAAVKRCTKEDE